jgi:hypothetical protein
LVVPVVFLIMLVASGAPEEEHLKSLISGKSVLGSGSVMLSWSGVRRLPG